MTVFVDTSAFLALLNDTDKRHEQAKRIWRRLVEQEQELMTTNYVLLETISLVQRRLGMSIVRSFQANIVEFLDILWVNEQLHREAVTYFLTANRRQLSLVDCISFVAMCQVNLQTAYVFDGHFTEQGFTVLE